MRKDGEEMATSTFNKTIYIGQEVAERLAEILEKSAPPRPEIDKDFWDENERKVTEWLFHFKRS